MVPIFSQIQFCNYYRMLHRHPITGESFGMETLRKERERRTVRAALSSVLSVRLREGYTIKNVSFKKGAPLFYLCGLMTY